MEAKDISPQGAQKGGQGGVDPARPDLTVVHDERHDVEWKAAPMLHDGLSNQEISLLCEIGERKTFDSTPGAAIEKLKAQRYIEPASHAAEGIAFQLTKKAQQFLMERGAGLNDA